MGITIHFQVSQEDKDFLEKQAKELAVSVSFLLRLMIQHLKSSEVTISLSKNEKERRSDLHY